DGLDVAACVDVGRQVASALVALHAKGALHRGIKPANIMLAAPDTLDVKLLDLGIVSLVHEKSVTEGSLVVGSKHTSAPEQLFGDPIDQRADIYGLGATLAHCWLGRPLYDDAGPVTAIVRKMLEAPERVRVPKRASPVVRTFLEFVNRCTRISPDDRPESAEACLATLDQLAAKLHKRTKRGRG
ncbi:MAG TPA: protein kinase, partial [Xanthomonadales bacterium]|nr:protein kinase [Xanthomonadales bacterium]